MKNPKSLRSFLLWLLTCVAFWGGYFSLEHFYPKAHYYAQFLAFFGFISLYFLLRALGRLFRHGPLRPLLDRFSCTLRKVTVKIRQTLHKLSQKVGKVFGQSDRKRLHGTDERSFLRREERRTDKGSRRRDRLRWNELTTNRDRLRFIYVRFVQQGGKRGYRYHPAGTPQENGRAWQFPEGTPEHDLFLGYTDARFAPEGERLNDEQLALYADLVGKKTKEKVSR